MTFNMDLQYEWTFMGPSWASLCQSFVGSPLLSPGSRCTQVFVCVLQESVSPVLYKFWWLYGGVNGDLLQEGLCHTQVCCTQSPCPCSSPLLTCTSSGDTPTQFCLILCGVSGSWCTQGMFEPSEHLCQLWGLILNVISPLLPSFWGFSFALGCGISPQSHSRAARLFWVRGGDFQKFGHCPLSGFLWSAFKLSWHLWVCHLAYANILQ